MRLLKTRFIVIFISILSLLAALLLGLQFFYSETLSVVKQNNKAVSLLEESLEKKLNSGGKSGGQEEGGGFWKGVLGLYRKWLTAPKPPPDGLDSMSGLGDREEQIRQIPAPDPLSEEGDLSLLTSSEPASKAYRHLLEAIGIESSDSRLYLNLGLSFELNGELDSSFLAYEKAQRYSGGDPKLEFLALYNAARIRGLEGKIPEALHLYQGALGILPHSIEVKTNIELLIQQAQQKGKGKSDKRGDGGSDPNEGLGKDEGEDGPIQNGRDQPRVFKSNELSDDDVKNILDEIQRQEQKIRARENRGAKDKPRGKDW